MEVTCKLSKDRSYEIDKLKNERDRAFIKKLQSRNVGIG